MQTETGLIRILLVEDDEVDAMLVRRTLSAGASVTGHLFPAFEMEHVTTLEAAWERIADHLPQVVLLDLNLTRTRGLDTFRQVRTGAPDIPIVVLTGLADDETAIQAIRLGAQDFLVKEQLDPRLLARTIRYAVERQRLQEVQRKAQLYLDIAAVILVALDADGRVTLINRRGSEILGYSEREIVGADWFERFIPERIRDELRESFMMLAGDGAEWIEYHENSVLVRDGSERLIAWHNTILRDGLGRFLGTLSSGEDITERRQAEIVLMRYMERLKTLQAIDRDILAAQSPGAIADVALTSLATLAPTACCAMVLLFDEQCVELQVLASSMRNAMEAGSRYPVAGLPGREQLEAGESVTLLDLARDAGDSRFLQRLATAGVKAGTAVPLRVRDELIGVLALLRREHAGPDHEEVAIARDLADSVAIAIHQSRLFEQNQAHTRELEKRVAERTAELSETNAELQAFAYTVSHDLRNPLWNIRGFSEALREAFGSRLGEDGREYIDAVLESVHTMESLIEDLLAYSRLSRAEIRIEPVVLDTVIEAAREHLASQLLASGAQVDVEVPLPIVQGHGPTLRRVITNLLANAIKFVPAGTRPRVRIRSERRDGVVRLWVEDNGIGIAPDAQERIFRVFERAGEGYPGTGIGLATVRRGIERLGGRVGVESAPEQGSRFWIELPG